MRGRGAIRVLGAGFYASLLLVSLVHAALDPQAHIRVPVEGVEAFGYRWRTLALYSALGLAVFLRVGSGWDAVPLSMSVILANHGAYELVHHLLLHRAIINRYGLAVFLKDTAFIAFFLSQNVYILRRVDRSRLTHVRKLALVSAGSVTATFVVVFSLLNLRSAAMGLAVGRENVPLRLLSPRWRLFTVALRSAQFGLKLALTLLYLVLVTLLREGFTLSFSSFSFSAFA